MIGSKIGVIIRNMTIVPFTLFSKWGEAFSYPTKTLNILYWNVVLERYDIIQGVQNIEKYQNT